MTSSIRMTIAGSKVILLGESPGSAAGLVRGFLLEERTCGEEEVEIVSTGTGILKCDAPGGPNFIEAYGWQWWADLVREVEEKYGTSNEGYDGDEAAEAAGC